MILLSLLLEQAQRKNGSYGTPCAPLVRTSLLRNLKICDGLGLLTQSNLQELKSGRAPVVTRGPYTGEALEVDHVVPMAVCSWLDCELADLELLPGSLNMGKSARVGDGQIALAKRFRAAGLIDDAMLTRVEEAREADQAKIAKYEMREE